MRMRLNAFLSATLCSIVLAAPATDAAAQSYPNKTVTMVVTAAAGGVTDVVARTLAQRLTEIWGQQIIIENRGGGAHILGASAVANAKPDGHTLMVAEAGTFVINPTLYTREKLPFDPDKAFEPITGLVRIHHAVVATPAFPAKSVADVIAMAKAKPKSVTFGTAGVGSGPHVNMARLQNAAGIEMVPVHYRGATPSFNDVMGGHTNMMMISVSSALPSSRSGKVKMLAIGSSKRLPQVPEVPTIAESGNLPGYIAGTWFGMAATGGTPKDVVDKINADVRKIIAEPAFREKFLERQMYEPMTSSPEEFNAYIKSELKNWAKVIKEQNLQIKH
jgi:tripartite-type tricarboxylate transporter receptor subunit TctC